MKVTPGLVTPEKLFRELNPGETFRLNWRGTVEDFVTTDLIRAAPDSEQPWDFRAAVGLASGMAMWLSPIITVAPTDMQAGPA